MKLKEGKFRWFIVIVWGIMPFVWWFLYDFLIFLILAIASAMIITYNIEGSD